MKYAIDSKRCQNSAFLYDCQDCEDCLLCWNQRNKRYCIANTQYSKEEYEKELKKYTLSSRSVYKKLEQQFSEYIKTHAYWKNLHLESTEKSTGDYLKNTKNCTDCYLVDESQDCENTLRCFQARNSKNSISVFDGDKIVNTSMAQDACYNISHCCDVNRCKNLDYCAHCYECEDCFASCGLV
ncbi:MAG: hypothetical protein H6767_02070 [Candidatus Peribacteria bacterium]|nr:MAG: hypothetical protein H6767_02070 [Candidatus Peribacteria bacterium]